MRSLKLCILLSLVACSQTNDAIEETSVSNSENFQFGEKIDGPANVRSKANGNLIFELSDESLVEMASPINDWVRIGIFIKVNEKQTATGYLEKGDMLYSINDQEVGRVLSDHSLLMINESDSVGYIEGFTHVTNIRSESIIENNLIDFIKEKGRSKDSLNPFIASYSMQNTDQFLDYDGYYVYENVTVDPSPGFRVLLLFRNEELKGIYHSRTIDLEKTRSYFMGNYNDHVTFFNDHPEENQVEFVNYMKNWLEGVD